MPRHCRRTADPASSFDRDPDGKDGCAGFNRLDVHAQLGDGGSHFEADAAGVGHGAVRLLRRGGVIRGFAEAEESDLFALQWKAK